MSEEEKEKIAKKEEHKKEKFESNWQKELAYGEAYRKKIAQELERATK